MKLLMHICCAPCANMPIDALRAEGVELTGYWYNPNIHPFTEYRARRNCLQEYAKTIDLPLLVRDDYGLRPFVREVAEDIAGRCVKCYEMRLFEAARAAKEGGFDAFTSSLFISPYQKHELMRDVGYRAAEEYGAALDLRLCDGLRGIAPHEADTVVMAGMGGETIIHILTDSPWPRDSGCTLLLQPQTKVELLRRWISENGYVCRDERLVWDKGKLYVVLQMTAGEPFTPDEVRLYGGLHLEGDPLYGDYLDAQLHRLRRQLDGLRHSREGEDCGTLPQLIAALEKKKEALK